MAELVWREVSAPAEPKRHACEACFKLFGSEERLADHVAKAGHSTHEPACASCGKHCKSLESLREHIHGHAGGVQVAKKQCSVAYLTRGCTLCLQLLDSPEDRDLHLALCRQVAASPQPMTSPSRAAHQSQRVCSTQGPPSPVLRHLAVPRRASGRRAVAIDCEMVGGGSDGSVDLCARICVIDDHENVLLNTFVCPSLPVTDYRTEVTGIRPQDLTAGMPFKAARRRVLAILSQRSSAPPAGDAHRGWHDAPAVRACPVSARERGHPGGGRQDGREEEDEGGEDTRLLLIGHDLRHDLHCLLLEYPPELLRDTATYPPLLRTNGLSHKLRYLTQTYLGYEIQAGSISGGKSSGSSGSSGISPVGSTGGVRGAHDPREDAVAALRLYMRMRSLAHAPPPRSDEQKQPPPLSPPLPAAALATAPPRPVFEPQSTPELVQATPMDVEQPPSESTPVSMCKSMPLSMLESTPVSRFEGMRKSTPESTPEPKGQRMELRGTGSSSPLPAWSQQRLRPRARPVHRMPPARPDYSCWCLDAY